MFKLQRIMIIKAFEIEETPTILEHNDVVK
jgi:hypothetical protein